MSSLEEQQKRVAREMREMREYYANNERALIISVEKGNRQIEDEWEGIMSILEEE